MYSCRLGSPTEYEQLKFSIAECMCDKSCELHIHSRNPLGVVLPNRMSVVVNDDYILCIHDGENDHSHCPNGDMA